jgi:hypothetical protein
MCIMGRCTDSTHLTYLVGGRQQRGRDLSQLITDQTKDPTYFSDHRGRMCYPLPQLL